MEHLKFYWRSLEYLVYYAEKATEFINKKLDIKQFETLHSCLALCGGPSLRQMKYGVSTKMTHFHEQDYAWIRCGMLFPFLEHVDRLQGQTDLNDSTPDDLHSAIEEASVWISQRLGVFTFKLGLLTRSLISNSLKFFILAGTTNKIKNKDMQSVETET
ncbi:hypothetical protein H5410_002239 [Solanum commersonii]|uniref:Uncharacterized protein n=1 Tax=Solanum commersonii TaxID=4109 RepID=A0A9J6B1S1_SOLCO|nr:hypothetical protein H5410_002239 [Solanum commersonii]